MDSLDLVVRAHELAMSDAKYVMIQSRGTGMAIK